MSISLKHKFASLIPDAGDPTIVQPSNWNDEHALTQATSTILGRVSALTGQTEELSPAQARALLNVADGATANSSDAFLLARANHTGTESADVLTDGTTNKAFLATERTKLAGIATGATANSTDAFLLARANHTGTQLAATISDFSTAADLRIAAAAATGTGSLVRANNATVSGTFTLGQDPATALEAATKQYVDNLAAGLDVKPSARAATTANITLSAPQTIDAVSVIAGDRVLVKDQSAPAQNGIYVVAAGAWTRATDMDAWTEVPGANVWVEEGTANVDRAWVCSANAGGTIGTTAITWSQFGGTGAFQAASANLTSWAAITRAAAVDTFANTGLLPIGNGGTGQITAAAAFDALSPTTTRGDLIFRNATTNARLAASTAGYLLQTNGAGTDPSYVGFTNGGTGAVTRTWNNKLIGSVDPYDFGAVGNGSTDDTTALQNAVNYCVTNKAILNLGNGFYKVSSSISVTGAVTIQGNGIFASKVLPTSTTKCFAINTTDAVIMRDFQITYTTTPISGSNIPAIEVTAASNENLHSVFDNLYIGLPYLGISFLKASVWTINNCYFNTSLSSTGAIAVIVDNQNLIDSGDSVITGSTFFGAAPGGGVTTTGISWVGSGGLRVTNNKFNGQTTAFLGVLPASKATGDIFVFNNSFENLTTGFSFSSGASSSFNFIQISNNEIWAVNPVVINAGSATFLRGISITGNTIKFDNTAYGVRLIGAVSNFTIDANVFYSLVAGATGINVDAATDGAIGVNSYNSNVSVHVVNASTAVQQVGDLLLAAYTAASSATLSDIVNLTSAYRGFRIVWHNLIPATTGVNLQLQVYEAGAYVTTGYANAAGGATTYIDLFPGTTIANTALYGCSGSVEIGETAAVSHARYIMGKAVAGTSVPAITVLQIAGFHNSSAVITGFRVQFSSGNIASGTLQVFGVP